MFDEHRFADRLRDLGQQAPGENAGCKGKIAIAKLLSTPGGGLVRHDLSKNSQYKQGIVAKRIDTFHGKAKRSNSFVFPKLSLHTAGDGIRGRPRVPGSIRTVKNLDSTWVDDGRKTSHCYEGTNLQCLKCKLILSKRASGYYILHRKQYRQSRFIGNCLDPPHLLIIQ